MAEENNQYPFENETYRKTYWHTCSHILAQAVKRLYPEVKLAIGPSIDEGWYYDMDAPFAFTPEHLEQIEAEMRKICKEKLKLERFELPRAEALKFMEEKGCLLYTSRSRGRTSRSRRCAAGSAPAWRCTPQKYCRSEERSCRERV